MKISWYPGHMHKAHKELKRTLPSTDAVIEILDARAPQASANPMLEEMTAKLPVLKILNKADLADSRITDNWLHYLNNQDSRVCILASADKQHLQPGVIKALQQLAANTPGNGVEKQKVLVIGVPNVGKSTVINALAGRKVTKTGNEPAVTRGQQQVKLGQDWMLLDTPGMLWPNLEDQRAALCLALIGSIRQTALDIEDVGWSAAELLYEIDPTALLQRYTIEEAPENTEALMTAIANKVGAIGKAGSINWHSAAESLLNDYRSGKLAAISLETPPG
jgi:ribosome biogenesis GTPase A